MLHLLTAIGGAPHLSRPNFPQPAKYYPPDFEPARRPAVCPTRADDDRRDLSEARPCAGATYRLRTESSAAGRQDEGLEVAQGAAA
jgi:hypothetical protein